MKSILIIKDESEEERIEVNYKKIQKMAFIYDALENGWEIKKITDDKYEFHKDDCTKKVEIQKFTKKHMKTKDILK